MGGDTKKEEETGPTSVAKQLVKEETKFDEESLEKQARKRAALIKQQRKSRKNDEEFEKGKEWNLEDDGDAGFEPSVPEEDGDNEEKEPKEENMEDDEEDPLDAFMNSLTGA